MAWGRDRGNKVACDRRFAAAGSVIPSQLLRRRAANAHRVPRAPLAPRYGLGRRPADYQCLPAPRSRLDPSRLLRAVKANVRDGILPAEVLAHWAPRNRRSPDAIVAGIKGADPARGYSNEQSVLV